MNRPRLFNQMDGTYVNVPDTHSIETNSKHIGIRKYNSGILVHNWFEDRSSVTTIQKINKKSVNNS
jgi:hypothetical protein